MLTNRSAAWPQHVTRRHVLSVGLSVAAVSLAGCSASRAVGGRNSSAPASAPAAAGVSTLPPDVSERLRGLEGASSRRIGVSLEAEDQRLRVGYRQDERFAMCSTYKVFVVACVFARIADLGEIIHYSNRELVEYSPITGLHVSTGLSVRELCAAAIEVSDNTAANLLLRRVGGRPLLRRTCALRLTTASPILTVMSLRSTRSCGATYAIPALRALWPSLTGS